MCTKQQSRYTGTRQVSGGLLHMVQSRGTICSSVPYVSSVRHPPDTSPLGHFPPNLNYKLTLTLTLTLTLLSLPY